MKVFPAEPEIVPVETGDSFFSGKTGNDALADFPPRPLICSVSERQARSSGEEFRQDVDGQRLQEHAGEAAFRKELLFFDVGGDGIDRKIGEAFILPDCRDQFPAVHVRHPDVGQNAVERSL